MTEVQRAAIPIRMPSTNTKRTGANMVASASAGSRPTSTSSFTAIQTPNNRFSSLVEGMQIPMEMPPRTGQMSLDTFSPVNQNGSFEFDRVLKSGYVEKRTRKTKAWKRIYLVLRPAALSIYKDAKEVKLRHKIALSELTAVAYLKDSKQKRQNIFGLFSPERNWHLEAPTQSDVQEWVELIRQQARIEEEEEEMMLASPSGEATRSYVGFERQMSGKPSTIATSMFTNQVTSPAHPHMLSNERGRRTYDEHSARVSTDQSDTPHRLPSASYFPSSMRRSSHVDYSGNEMASHSDMSDVEHSHSLPYAASTVSIPIPEERQLFTEPPPTIPYADDRPMINHNISQASGINIESDPERVVWQGYLLYLKSSKGMKQWRQLWGVLRPKNLALYKDESEYSPRLIIPLSSVINAVEIDPVSRTKRFCMQIITEEKSFRFCAQAEVELDKALGAFKSLLAKRDVKKRADTFRSV